MTDELPPAPQAPSAAETRPVNERAPAARGIRRRRRVALWLRRSAWRHAVAWAACFFALFPIVWIVSAAFNSVDNLAASKLIPSDVTFGNFVEAFTDDVSPVARWMWNSFYISVTAAAFNVLVAAWGAYAFSRIKFRGRRTLLTSLLVMQIFPQFLGFVAFFVLAQEFGDVWAPIGLNTHLFLIVVYLGGAAGFNAFLLKGFLDSIPTSLDEAAVIDGASSWIIFSRIIMPLARPMLAVIFMISFVAIFGEFILASFLLKGEDQLTLPVGLQVFLAEGYNAKWGVLAATALVGAAPVVGVFLAAQKHIIAGLTGGAVKG
ncbi:sugar ABC transporter permease [Candidatus Poriferisodalis sp.]|uniref:sugar ABC transporter permease n=1 Tax=Candidatus Poriferisodalis sp. TaxID=3101277 RepID=UPI003B02BAE1